MCRRSGCYISTNVLGIVVAVVVVVIAAFVIAVVAVVVAIVHCRCCCRRTDSLCRQPSSEAAKQDG